MWVVVKDGTGWGVADAKGILENQEPFKSKEEAKAFRAAIYQAHNDWNANLAYWSSSRFGE